MRLINLQIRTLVAVMALASTNVHADNPVEQIGAGVAETAEGVGSAVTQVGGNVTEYASDSTITTAVKSRIAVESSNFLQVSVSTIKGVVYLSGHVDTKAQANRVIEIAKDTPGVTKVDTSQLTVGN